MKAYDIILSKSTIYNKYNTMVKLKKEYDTRNIYVDLLQILTPIITYGIFHYTDNIVVQQYSLGIYGALIPILGYTEAFKASSQLVKTFNTSPFYFAEDKSGAIYDKVDISQEGRGISMSYSYAMLPFTFCTFPVLLASAYFAAGRFQMLVKTILLTHIAIELAASCLDYLCGLDKSSKYICDTIDADMIWKGQEDEDGNCEFVLRCNYSDRLIPLWEVE